MGEQEEGGLVRGGEGFLVLPLYFIYILVLVVILRVVFSFCSRERAMFCLRARLGAVAP